MVEHSGQTHYWSANVTVTLHGLDERPIAGATVTAVWSGAVVKTVTCVTNAPVPAPSSRARSATCARPSR